MPAQLSTDIATLTPNTPRSFASSPTLYGARAFKAFKTAQPVQAVEKEAVVEKPAQDFSSPVTIRDLDWNDETDDGTERTVQFEKEQTKAPVSIGAYSRAGWELAYDGEGNATGGAQRKANQDAYAVLGPFGAEGGLFVGVFDGHGAQGRTVSQLVRDTVPHALREHLEASADQKYAVACSVAFRDSERVLTDESREISHGYSGTTATCAWITAAEVYVAWAGDSRCILGRTGGPGTDVRPIELTWDHKPTRPDEKSRVRAAGGRVMRWQKGVGPQRVWLPHEMCPGLSMTRSIGDTILTDCGVTPEPEVTVTRLGSSDAFLVAASDGVWEFMTSVEVAEFVGRLHASGASAEATAKSLVREAVTRWRSRERVVDDTTAVVVWLDYGADGEDEGCSRRGRACDMGSTAQASPDKPHLITDDGSLAPLWSRGSGERRPQKLAECDG